MSISDEFLEVVKDKFPPDGVFVECPETGRLVFVETGSEDEIEA